MKRTTMILMASLTMLMGCGKKEDPEMTPSPEADTTAAETVEIEQETVMTTPLAPDMGNNLIATEEQAKSMIEETKKTVTDAAGSIDWANLSWDKVSSVPFSDREKLLEWATPQINALRDKLSKAAMQQGQISLSNLGDSGWQGTVKNIVSALENVRNSSPETWESARNSLMTAWEALQEEAAKMMGNG